MADAHRGTSVSLIELLKTEPDRFDSRQAVRVLDSYQRLHQAKPVRFRSSLSLAFPISDIESVRVPPPASNLAPTVTVSFLGLGGAMGPLPTPYTEYLNAAVRRREPAGRDFLDLFNHRLVTSSMTLAKLFRPALQPGLPQDSDHAARLYALLGLGTPGIAASTPHLAAALLPLAGLLNQRPLSAHAVERAISSHFGVAARVIPLLGGWGSVPGAQRSAIGRAGRNQRLGTTAMLGGRYWDQSANITLEIGPIALEEAELFLPHAGSSLRPPGRKARIRQRNMPLPPAPSPANRHWQMAGLLDFLLADTVGVRLRLLVRRPTLRPSRLAGTQPMRLGWTSWLQRDAPAADDTGISAIVLRPAIAVPHFPHRR